jgi:TPR repeat protein
MKARMKLLVGLALIAAAALIAPAFSQSEKPDGLEKACRAGSAFDCANLAVLYRHGRGVKTDNVRALTLFVRACEGGNDFACGSVGDMVYRGLGIAPNSENGRLLLGGACRRQNEWSCETMRRLGIAIDRS